LVAADLLPEKLALQRQPGWHKGNINIIIRACNSITALVFRFPWLGAGGFGAMGKAGRFCHVIVNKKHWVNSSKMVFLPLS
jgi:hypothetical protein